MELIDKFTLVAEIERRIEEIEKIGTYLSPKGTLTNLLCYINTLEVKERVNEKIKWFPSKKQMKSLKDMLEYNIGVFDYQKFMEVNSLYDDLTKILDYGTDRQK